MAELGFKPGAAGWEARMLLSASAASNVMLFLFIGTKRMSDLATKCAVG